MSTMNRQSERQTPTLSPRNLGALLDETFSIYGRHLRRFAAIVILVQVPVHVVILLMVVLAGTSVVTQGIIVLLGSFTLVLVYGAAVSAVGQQYITGEVAISRCYSRALTRVKTLAMLTMIVVVAVLSVVPAFLVIARDQSLLAGLVVLMLVPVIAIGSIAVQAVIVEGFGAIGALRRSFALIRGSWWRIFGITVVVLLIALGLGILMIIPFALALEVFGADQGSALGNLLLFLADIIVRVTVQPVLFIAGTLLYYDLRVRNEQYDFATLSNELGIVPV